MRRSAPPAAAALFVVALLPERAALAQQAEGDRVRVFLDCQAIGCDFDLTRREITWVDWVRQREDADVHILLTSSAAGAGTAFDIRFIGRQRFDGEDLALSHVSSSTDTSDERRRGLVERFKVGLVRYVAQTPEGALLRVTSLAPAHDEPAEAAVPGSPRDGPAPGETDRWNLWVFGMSVGGNASGQSLTSSTSFNGSLSASRTSESWKLRWGASARYSRDEFELSDGNTIDSVSRNSGTDLLVVRSAGPHWGIGGRASVTSSSFSNQDLKVTVEPALEFNVFPYEESSRRTFTFQYRAGVSRVGYDTETVFGVTEETIWQESLRTSLGMQQPWGSVSSSVTLSHFLNDPSKNRVSLSGNTNVRIVRGLSLNFFGDISRVRDQVFLPRGSTPDQDVILRRRALQTDFDYFLNFSVSYTFGSIFNTIVNPRFDGSSGQIIFISN